MTDEFVGVGQVARKRLRDLGGYHAEEVYAGGPLSATGALLVGSNRVRFREEFGGASLDLTKWETVSTGDGMTITLPGVTTSYLNINSGVDVNSETIIRGQSIFQLPVRLNFGVSASQRIANTEFFVELIKVNESGVPITKDESGVDALVQANSGQSPDYAAVKFDGTTATSVLVVARGGAAPETVSAASTITTTAATGTGPNFVPAHALEMQVSGEHVVLLSSSIDSLSVASGSRRITQCAPDPSAFYRLQVRVRNLATAPASATDWRLHFVRLNNDTRLATEIMGGVGSGNAASAPAVSVAGSVSTAEGTLALGTSYAVVTTASLNAAVIKTSTANLFEFTARNPTASPVFVKLYNKTTAVNFASDVPILTISMPANSFKEIEFGRIGKRFSAGLAIAVTGALADTDTTNAVAGAQISMTYI